MGCAWAKARDRRRAVGLRLGTALSALGHVLYVEPQAELGFTLGVLHNWGSGGLQLSLHEPACGPGVILPVQARLPSFMSRAYGWWSFSNSVAELQSCSPPRFTAGERGKRWLSSSKLVLGSLVGDQAEEIWPRYPSLLLSSESVW